MPRGRPPKKDKELQEGRGISIPNKKDIKQIKDKFACFYCGKEYVDTNFYNSNSEFYSNIGKIPYCKQCIEKLYQQYYEKYTNDGCLIPEKKAVQRLCMIFDIYYKDDIYDNAINSANKREMNISHMGAYMKMIQLNQYNRNKESYETTIYETEQSNFDMSSIVTSFGDVTVDQKTIDFFGNGFNDDDYKFLKKEYEDWTARHECNTKAQEEVFKRICFKQLEILRATRRGEDTKNLDDTFQKLLDTAKLQPKQNAGDTTADNQTFGTLIDKWENERPLPEIDEELKDVDKIALYIDIFFKGHLSKMMNLKNGFSKLYETVKEKYTVHPPQYVEDEDSQEVKMSDIFAED